MSDKLDRLRAFYRENKVMPTYDELCILFGFKSKNAAFKLVNKWVEDGLVEKMDKGRLKPGAVFLGLPLFNSVQAGPPTLEEEVLLDHIDLNDFLVRHPDRTVLINVRGDSMIDAGIHEGDKVVVEIGARVVPGDIAVAIVDGAYTVKRYDQTSNGQIILRPENAAYKPIIPLEELRIFGKVVGVVRKM